MSVVRVAWQRDLFVGLLRDSGFPSGQVNGPTGRSGGTPVTPTCGLTGLPLRTY